MKRLIVFILITVLMCVVGMHVADNFNIGTIFPDAMVEMYIEDDFNEKDFQAIKNGSGFVVFCKADDVDALKKTYNVIGITIKLEKNNLATVLKRLSAEAVHMENDYIYGRSLFFCDYIQVQCCATNFQCVERENCILIGSPILLGCY